MKIHSQFFVVFVQWAICSISANERMYLLCININPLDGWLSYVNVVAPTQVSHKNILCADTTTFSRHLGRNLGNTSDKTGFSSGLGSCNLVTVI